MVLGNYGRLAIDLIIAMAQFSFTVSHISFIIQSMHTTVSAIVGTSLQVWPFLIGTLFVITPTAWVDNLQKLSPMLILGNLLILTTLVVVSVYCVYHIHYEGGLGPD